MSSLLMSDALTESLSNDQHSCNLSQLKQSITKAEQQAKFLHLQAEVESLWQKVKYLKHQQ